MTSFVVVIDDSDSSGFGVGIRSPTMTVIMLFMASLIIDDGRLRVCNCVCAGATAMRVSVRRASPIVDDRLLRVRAGAAARSTT